MDRGIIFSGPMVRALLDGRKTMTRRLAWGVGKRGLVRPTVWQKVRPGDRLYCREAWKPHSIYSDLRPSQIPKSKIFYRADDTYAPSNTPWVPSIHMPRWASRLTLEVTAVKMERLQGIKDWDAVAEGIDPKEVAARGWVDATVGFRDLWNFLHGPGAWEANPEVVAMSFKAHPHNIDQEKAG